MKLLVTGGAGYLGAEICRQALAAGDDVLATKLHAAPPHGQVVELDLRDDEEVQRRFLKHGPELVVHTAYRQADDALQGDVVRASRNVALASHRAGARLVHVSTDLVFDGEAGAPYDEERRTAAGVGLRAGEARRGAARPRAPPGGADRPHVAPLRTCRSPARRSGSRCSPSRRSTSTRSARRCNAADVAAALLELGPRDDVPRLLHVAGPDRRLALRLRPAPPRRARPRPRCGHRRADSARPRQERRTGLEPGRRAARDAVAGRPEIGPRGRLAATLLPPFHRVFGEMGPAGPFFVREQKHADDVRTGAPT